MLTSPIHASTVSTASEPEYANAAPMNAAPITSETSGPAMAIRNSAPADGNRPRNFATPPRSQSVIPSICIPSRRASNACPSSCRRSELKKRSDATTAIAQYVDVARPGTASGKTPVAHV